MTLASTFGGRISAITEPLIQQCGGQTQQRALVLRGSRGLGGRRRRRDDLALLRLPSGRCRRLGGGGLALRADLLDVGGRRGGLGLGVGAALAAGEGGRRLVLVLRVGDTRRVGAGLGLADGGDLLLRGDAGRDLGCRGVGVDLCLEDGGQLQESGQGVRNRGQKETAFWQLGKGSERVRVFRSQGPRRGETRLPSTETRGRCPRPAPRPHWGPWGLQRRVGKTAVGGRGRPPAKATPPERAARVPLIAWMTTTDASGPLIIASSKVTAGSLGASATPASIFASSTAVTAGAASMTLIEMSVSTFAGACRGPGGGCG